MSADLAAAIAGILADDKTCIKDAYRAVLLHAQQEESQVAELERDAARYRHLRNVPTDQMGMPGVPCIAMPNGMQSGYYLNDESADFAIDAAMKEPT